MTLSVIIPVLNDAQMLARCLAAIGTSTLTPAEIVVVDDGSTEDVSTVVDGSGARLIRIADGPRGPAHARNVGARAATGSILVFVDADVLIRADTLARFAQVFATRPDLDAVFGSYDDEPATLDFVSQFKNLFHHFVHQHASTEAETFWSGCGAVRTAVFLSAGGFDDVRYPRPSIEDIELGYRLRAEGRRIMLSKDIQVKHLKRWTLRGMIHTDVFDRGVPWTRLILERRRMPNDLNLHVLHRLSAMLACSMLLYVGIIAFFHSIVMLPLIAALFLIVVGAMNWSDDAPLFSLVSRRSEVVSYLLIAIIAGIAISRDALRMLPPLAVLAVGMLCSRWIPGLGLAGRRILFPVVLGALVTNIAVLLSQFSLPVVAPLLAAAAIIAILNYRLYVFFARRRGVTFALAALPMHLLYYAYTLIALALGTTVFLTAMPERRQGVDAA